MTREAALLCNILAELRCLTDLFCPAGSGRKPITGYDYRAFLFTPAPNNQRVFARSPRRRGIVVGAAGGIAANLWIATNVGTNAGWVIPTTGYMEFWRERHGAFVTEEFYVNSTGPVLSCVEVY